MRLSIGEGAIAFALLWGGLLLVVGLINLAVPISGSVFSHEMSSVDPGFGTLADVLVGTDSAADGVLGGRSAVGSITFSHEHERKDVL